MLLSFVIPCYRSENTVAIVVDMIEKVMIEHISYEYEIILVDDGSPDKVWLSIKELCKKSSMVRAIQLSNNFGQHSALASGMKIACGDIIIGVDDDGQAPVQDVFKLVDKLNEGYDMVCAKYEDQKRGLFRKFGSAVNEWMANTLLNKPKDYQMTSFWAIKSFIKDELITCHTPNLYIAGYTLRVTHNVANVMLEAQHRISGKSNYTFGKLLGLWMNGFTAFSIKPLRLASLMGVFCAGSGFIFGLITAIKRLFNPSMQAGYSSLMAIILFIGGMLMIMLGLLGEYIGRIYMCVNGNPQYAIRNTINIKEKPDSKTTKV